MKAITGRVIRQIWVMDTTGTIIGVVRRNRQERLQWHLDYTEVKHGLINLRLRRIATMGELRAKITEAFGSDVTIKHWYQRPSIKHRLVA